MFIGIMLLDLKNVNLTSENLSKRSTSVLNVYEFFFSPDVKPRNEF